MLAVISYVYEALSQGVTVTKRDIYYRDGHLFKSQAVVDDALQRLTSHLDIQRHQLNVAAAAKGLLRGNLCIRLVDGSVLDCRRNDILIDRVEDYVDMEIGVCDAILIIEKEAVYHSLISSSFHDTDDLNCIMITGKGYPDLNTRRFICYLERHLMRSSQTLHRSIPFLCLVDFDPFGLEILAIYKYGSHTMALNNEFLTVSKLKWLGIHINDFSTGDPAVLPFTITDDKKLENLDCRTFLQDLSDARDWAKQIAAMKSVRKKAEIEVLSDRSGGMAAQLKRKVLNHAWL